MHEYGNRHLTHDALVTTDNGVLLPCIQNHHFKFWHSRQPSITDIATDTKAMPNLRFSDKL